MGGAQRYLQGHGSVAWAPRCMTLATVGMEDESASANCMRTCTYGVPNS